MLHRAVRLRHRLLHIAVAGQPFRGMAKRQKLEGKIVAIPGESTIGEGGVLNQVVMAQHHTFRIARRA